MNQLVKIQNEIERIRDRLNTLRSELVTRPHSKAQYEVERAYARLDQARLDLELAHSWLEDAVEKEQ